MPNPPNSIRHNASSPSACQNVIVRNPNIDGVSQFHSDITTQPPTATNNAIANSANGAISNSLFFLIMSSPLEELVVNVLQPLAQVQHRVPLAREQRVHVHAALRRQLLKAPPLQFVRHKHLALLAWQLLQ